MDNLNSRVMTFWAILVFSFSLTLAFLFRDYQLSVSGLLLFVILTAFIPGWRSTLAAGVISMVVMTALVIYFKKDDDDITRALLSQIYSLFVVIFSVVVIFYSEKNAAEFCLRKNTYGLPF